MKKILLSQLVLLSVVYLTWYFLYPEHIWWTEANAFFAWTPDYFTLGHTLPKDLPAVVAAYIAQFYKWKIWGALIQTAFTGIVLYASDLIVYRITREKNALWLAFIPASLFWYFQIGESTLVYSVCWSAAFLAAAGASLLIPRKARRNVSGIFCFRKAAYSYVLPAAIFGAVFYSGYLARGESREQERVYEAEHLAILHKWELIEKKITPERIGQNLHILNILFLALNETGRLPEKLFCYPLSTSNNFFFERNTNPACCRFNSLLYDCLGVDNEAIHQIFQASIQSDNGMTFHGLRMLTDWNLKSRNFPLAEKYMEILRHTTCHGNWLKSREALLASLKNSRENKKEPTPFFIGAHPFLSDMARLVDQDPENEKAAHYLLCGLLVGKDLEKFRQVFAVCYPNIRKETLQRHYEEALVMLSDSYPDILTKYPIRKERIKEYKDFSKQQGSLSELSLRSTYGNTFWYYARFRNI